MTQYSNRMVVIHWLTLILVITAWYLGYSLDEAREEHGATLTGYLAHAMAGITVLLLTMIRWLFRRMDGTPPPMGNTLMDKVAKGVHHALYLMLIIVPASGVITAAASGVSKALLTGNAALLPKNYDSVAAHDVHEILVNVLIVLVVVHVLGAIMHQFIMKDSLMERMSLHKKQ